MAKHLLNTLIAVVVVCALLPVTAQETVIDASNVFRLQEIARLGRGKVYNAQFSPDGRQILVGSSLGVWIYDSDELDTVTEPSLLPTSRAAEYVDQSPNGLNILVGYSDIVQVWIGRDATYALDTGRRLSALALSRDGDLLATAHSNNTIQFRQSMSVDPIIPQGYSIGVQGFAFSPDGKLLATGSDDGSLGLWDIENGVSLSVYRNEVDVRVLKFMPDGSSFGSGEDAGAANALNSGAGISVIVVETGAGITALEFLTDSSAIVTGNEVGVVSLWDATTARRIVSFDEGAHRRSITALAVSPDGTLAASGGREGDIQLWDMIAREQASGKDVQAWIQPERGAIKSLQFSPDGSLLLVSAAEEFVGLYDVASRGLLRSAVGHNDDIVAFDFSPQSKELTVADDDGNVWFWRVGSNQEITQIPQLEDFANSRENRTNLQYAPDGSFVAVNRSSDVFLLDPATGETLRILDVDGSPSGLSVSPDSSLVAVTSNWNLSVFSVETGFLVAKISEHNDRLLAAQFSPDQRLLASASVDGTLRIYGLDG